MQFLGNLRSVRDSYAAMSTGSLPTTEQPSSIMKIILDCESALTFLNRSLSVLSTSVAREQEKALWICIQRGGTGAWNWYCGWSSFLSCYFVFKRREEMPVKTTELWASSDWKLLVNMSVSRLFLEIKLSVSVSWDKNDRSFEDLTSLYSNV